jgi:outer membrane protein insertion porin family
MINYLNKFIKVFVILVLFSTDVFSQVIKKIEIIGSERISPETIIVFSEVNINDNVNENDLNIILKKLYKTNYFKNIVLKIDSGTLYIDVLEQPIIENIQFKKIKNKEIIEELKNNLKLKNRNSYNEFLLKKDNSKIISILKDKGYYFAKVSPVIISLDENKIELIYEIDLGKKAKISKIRFIGDKIYKDKKLRNVITSEETKFWKFISGKKFLNENLIKFDQKLLKNFYLNEGYYNVVVNSSYAKLKSNDHFEVIFNINANEKIYFDKVNLVLPNDYNRENFEKIYKIFTDIKNTPYSISSIDKILNAIDEQILSEQFEPINASVDEVLEDNKINLTFIIEETEKIFIEKINILGNNVTDEKVIRNQLEIDEGDPFNEILANKSINNLKSLNFFKTVKTNVVDSKNENNKILNIIVEEKPTGEIMAGAGVGTSGSTISFGIKENNFLGNGIGLNTKVTMSEQDFKGSFSVTNPNFRNSDKEIQFTVQAIETDKFEESGYKSNKSGFSLGTKFEYYDNLKLGISSTNFYEKISTNTTASARQQKQEGNYWDSFINLDFIYDKRNQKFQTTKGFLSWYEVDLPILSDTNTFANSYKYKVFKELYDDNVSSFSLNLKSAFSLKSEDIKLSERLFIPSSSLRGFERGKVGPKDNNDFVGGNYLASINFSSTLPQILPSYQNTDFLIFLDAANIWGVDYDSSLDGGSEIRSSIGFGIDWFTPIGPMNFSFATPITKGSNDITETFRFDLGTSF